MSDDNMAPLIFWMLGISFAAAVMVLLTAMDAHVLQFALSFVIAAFIALAGIRDHRALQRIGAFPAHAASTLVRHMGLIYGWSAVSIVLVYGLLLTWPKWFAAFFLMCLGATLCMFMANVLMRDLTEESDDSNMIALVSTIAKAQFAATCVMFGGLLTFGNASSIIGNGAAGWAAVNVMLCAALALASLSGYVLAAPNVEPVDADAANEAGNDGPATSNGSRAPSASAKPRTGLGHRPPQKAFGRARPA